MANVTKPVILDETGQSIASAISTMGATSVGNLSALTTTDKTSLVGAVNEVKSGLNNYEFTDSITTHGQWTNTSITDMSIYAGKVIYGYMSDASLNRTYTFAIPVDHMPELQAPIWVQHDVSDIGNSDTILVAKNNYTSEFMIFLGVNIPDMTLHLFVH